MSLMKTALRVNQLTATHRHPMNKTDKVTNPHFRGGAKLLPRPEGTALGQTNDLWIRPIYTTGMGDTSYATRPGSMDFMQLESRGYLT